MTPLTDHPEVAVVLGRCDEVRAEVYVRLADDAARLVGTITGPRRGRDTTLPVTARLVPLDGRTPNTEPVSRAILTEPAYWTPDLPNLYRVEAAAEGCTRRIDVLFGLRRLGVRGRSFWLDGRRWVPRAAAVADLGPLKAATLGALLSGVTEADLARADAEGLAVLPVLGGEDLTAARVAALARHPAAMLAIVREDVSSDTVAAVIGMRGTMLIGRAVDGHAAPPPSVAPFDFLVVMLPGGGVPHAAWRTPPTVPLVAWRCDPASVSTARAACDVLQRDLAAWRLPAASDGPPWDWAGYCVG